MKHLVLFMGMLMALMIASDVKANSKYASAVMRYDTGEFIYGRKMDKSLHPASMTKMMTLYLAFDAIERGKLSFDQKLTVSRHAQSMPASELGLRAGQKIRVIDLIESVAVKSANDSAVVLAEALGKTEYSFARKMTQKARALGMSRTTFRNASGLHHSKQVSTARDMAILSRALIRDFPQHYHLFGQKSFKYGNHTYRSSNRLLGRYDGMDGLKTGYIRAAGFNLAASAKRDGLRLIGVVFGGKTSGSRNQEMVRLLDLGFERTLEERQRLRLVSPSPLNPLRQTVLIAVKDEQVLPEFVAQGSDEGEASIGPPRLKPGTEAFLNAITTSVRPVFNPRRSY